MAGPDSNIQIYGRQRSEDCHDGAQHLPNTITLDPGRIGIYGRSHTEDQHLYGNVYKTRHLLPQVRHLDQLLTGHITIMAIPPKYSLIRRSAIVLHMQRAHRFIMLRAYRERCLFVTAWLMTMFISRMLSGYRRSLLNLARWLGVCCLSAGVLMVC